jgi:hypothetical protein
MRFAVNAVKVFQVWRWPFDTSGRSEQPPKGERGSGSLRHQLRRHRVLGVHAEFEAFGQGFELIWRQRLAQ